MTPQRIQAFSITDTGRKRSNNQDACAVLKKGDWLLMAVADGVGGNLCGEIASRLAIQTLQKGLEQTESLDPKTFLSQAASNANQAIRNYVTQHPECKGMATTLTAALVHFPEAHLLQIGDSRAYLLREGTLRRLTEDHTLVGKMVKEGLLSKEEARTHPKRHVIINALGISPDQRSDYFSVKLKPNDQILLCSDGLYDEISEDEIRMLLLKNNPKEAMKRLIDAANAAGGKDNISIALAVLDGKKMGETRRFKVSPAPKPSRKGPLKWFILLLCLAALAGGAWIWGQSTESGKRVKSYVLTLMGHGPVKNASRSPQGKETP